MGHQLELVQHVNASPEAVWQVITDIENAPATLSGITKVEVLTPGPYAEGFRWRETRKLMGKEATEEMWVASADAPRATTVKARSGGADYTTRFTLAPAGGGTELKLFFGAELEKPGWFSSLMMALFGKLGMSVTRKAIATDLREIAAKAESLEAKG